MMPLFSRAGLRACLLCVLGALSCSHVEVAVPGVLDLRSDASALDVDKAPAKGAKGADREGMSALFGGDGVKTAGANVTVEGRVWWLASLIRLSDGAVTDGLRTGIGASALRDVVITEELTTGEAIAFYCGLPIPCAAAFLPTRTVRASGTRVVAPPAERATESAP